MKKIINFCLFSNLYIALTAVLLCCGTFRYFQQPFSFLFLFFIFSATLSSYNLHWYLTTHKSHSPRIIWTTENKPILLIFSLLSSIICFVSFIFLEKIRFEIVALALLTLLYSAPKIPIAMMKKISGVGFGKTFYLAIVWTLVTVLLPLLNAAMPLNTAVFLFATHQCLFLLAVCALFDFRDQKEDAGISNWVTYMTKKQITVSIFLLFCLFITFIFLIEHPIDNAAIKLTLPFLLLMVTLPFSLRTKNDYWFYVFLDGLMLLSGLLIAFE
jgi:hypothetical protein